MPHGLTPTLQPVVIRSVPLRQLPVTTSPRPPRVSLLPLPRVALPQATSDHPCTHRLLTDMNAMPLGQLLASEGRPEIVPFRLLQICQRPLLHLFRNLPV